MFFCVFAVFVCLFWSTPTPLKPPTVTGCGSFILAWGSMAGGWAGGGGGGYVGQDGGRGVPQGQAGGGRFGGGTSNRVGPLTLSLLLSAPCSCAPPERASPRKTHFEDDMLLSPQPE